MRLCSICPASVKTCPSLHLCLLLRCVLAAIGLAVFISLVASASTADRGASSSCHVMPIQQRTPLSPSLSFHMCAGCAGCVVLGALWCWGCGCWLRLCVWLCPSLQLAEVFWVEGLGPSKELWMADTDSSTPQALGGPAAAAAAGVGPAGGPAGTLSRHSFADQVRTRRVSCA